ncbi:MAG TPA: RNA polymerase sigma factor RpoD/SigA [Candidatus Polarisedimenticolia bacterium]|nr:RNA polymerase sigma factor RpoD/SigA [Candidatus Polarisedimenticolia bacterium]
MNLSRSRSRPAMAAYISEIRRFPLLSVEAEQSVAMRYRDAESLEDLHTLVQSNLKFVIRIASQYRGGLLSMEDLVAEGNLGLLRAARRYDPRRGNRFLSCAIWWIRKAILDALENRAALIRLPRHRTDQIQRARRVRGELSGRLGRRPDREEIGRELGVPPGEVAALETSSPRHLSLDSPTGAESRTLADILPDPKSELPDEVLFRREERERVRRALSRLGSREFRILSRRFGLDGRGGMTLQEMGDELGVSREAVRQLESRARSKLLRFLAQEAACRETEARVRRAVTRRTP